MTALSDLGVLWDAISHGPPGFHMASVVDTDGRYGTPGESWAYWIETADWRRFERVCRLAAEVDVRIGTVPYAERERRHFITPRWALWARVEGRESLRLLAAFRPEPTLLLREGDTTRHTSLWALRRPLSPDHATKANRRLSYTLRTKRQTAEPDFAFTPPGGVIRAGRTKPVAVSVAGGTRELYPAGLVVGDATRRDARLPILGDPPPPAAPETWGRAK